jgi:hypothetical protein
MTFEIIYSRPFVPYRTEKPSSLRTIACPFSPVVYIFGLSHLEGLFIGPPVALLINFCQAYDRVIANGGVRIVQGFN